MKQLKETIPCGMCGSPLHLREKKQTLVFRNVPVETPQLVYECDECLSDFDTTEVMDINLERIEDKYNEIVDKHKQEGSQS